MKKALLLLLIAGSSLLMGAGNASRGVQFREEGWGSVSKSAKASGKPIFTFIRTQSCNTSRRMDDIFKKPAVAEFINSNFVSIEINPDHSPMDNIRVTNWGAKSVPAFIFFDASKKKVHMIHGYRDEAAIIKEAEKALKAMGIAYKKPSAAKPANDGPVQIIDDGGDEEDEDEDDEDDE